MVIVLTSCWMTGQPVEEYDSDPGMEADTNLPTSTPVSDDTASVESTQTCESLGLYTVNDCNGACHLFAKCEADGECYRCNSVCANDEYYNDQACAGLCTEGVNTCVQTNAQIPCFRCQGLDEPNPLNNTPNNNTPAPPNKTYTFDIEYDIIKIEDVTLVTGTLSGDLEHVQSLSFQYLEHQRNRIVPTQLDSGTGLFRAETSTPDNFEYSFHVTTKDGQSHIIEEGIREKQKTCEELDVYSENKCEGNCDLNSKCVSDTQNDGCYKCEAVCADDEYYNDNECSASCTQASDECTLMNANTLCYKCAPKCTTEQYYDDTACDNACGGDQFCSLVDEDNKCYACETE